MERRAPTLALELLEPCELQSLEILSVIFIYFWSCNQFSKVVIQRILFVFRGYMAPEYALWGYLTNKADIYSFGVVALEIVSGKNNTSYKPENECVCLLDLVIYVGTLGIKAVFTILIVATSFKLLH